MCGIAGIQNINSGLEYLDIRKITQCINHRGPDGLGTWKDDSSKVSLGHTRLSILDLSTAGSQPMILEDNLIIVFNGEVYNFIEIRKELLEKGYTFLSTSDTEVILASYKEWGLECFNKFNGMWALAIWDKKKRELLLSRDRYGVKPLYYFFNDGLLVFSSEIKAIHSFFDFKNPLNEVVIKDIARGSFDYHGTTSTYLQDVHSLPGGHNLIVKDNSLKVEEWYTIKKINVPSEFEGQVKELRTLIFDACKIRLRSDVPVGTCLSGGVDSGSITSVINGFKETEFNNYSHKGFCASFPETAIDESSKAKALADSLNVSLDIVPITPPGLEELKQAMMQCVGE